MDSRALLEGNRLDNAIYLGGYVVECSLKALISLYLSPPDTRRYGHSLSALQGAPLRQLQALVSPVQFKMPATRTAGTVLEHGHPERRYWASGHWTQQEVKDAFACAYAIYRETVVAMVLDGQLSDRELDV